MIVLIWVIVSLFGEFDDQGLESNATKHEYNTIDCRVKMELTLIISAFVYYGLIKILINCLRRYFVMMR